MFPDDVIAPRALENRPGYDYDPDKLSWVYAEDLALMTDNIEAIENYLLGDTLLLKSPNKTWEITIDDNGVITTTEVV